jgi:hypothetical protein
MNRKCGICQHLNRDKVAFCTECGASLAEAQDSPDSVFPASPTGQRVQRQVERLLDEAEAWVVAGDWVRVREAAEDALNLDPGNREARTLLASASRKQTTPAKTEATTSLLRVEQGPSGKNGQLLNGEGVSRSPKASRGYRPSPLQVILIILIAIGIGIAVTGLLSLILAG